ncbi:MAG: protein TolR [Thiobacillaceae bacterium]|nr:protein TolR [Thiobacillaceae bacterium]MCX7672889.1 protein TolR [Thiobacillaceae bacterium]MDW8324279.1 protein TolR [Burkholderiales bacterium]
MRRVRRSINQINVVPYIDVMLVLLVIFMVTAPFINPSQVELPSVGKAGQAPAAPLEVVVRADGSLLLRDRAEQGHEELIDPARLVHTVRARLARQPRQPVVISADKSVRYEAVMQVMDGLQRAGAARVGLLVRPSAP